VLAGAAAIACVRRFAAVEHDAAAFAAWHERPRKVVLRARGGQWPQLLHRRHALAGDPDGEAVIALPPRGPSQRDELLGRMQAMTSDLAPPPTGDEVADEDDAPLTYLLNPSVRMSSGKAMAQVAHAAVMAAERADLAGWLNGGCRARVRVPEPTRFAALCAGHEPLARVVDAGLTEVAPGTVTVLVLATVASER
jgi:peptidyl-tRNA hydrolase